MLPRVDEDWPDQLPQDGSNLLGVEEDVGKIKGKIGFYLNDDGEIVLRLEE